MQGLAFPTWSTRDGKQQLQPLLLPPEGISHTAAFGSWITFVKSLTSGCKENYFAIIQVMCLCSFCVILLTHAVSYSTVARRYKTELEGKKSPKPNNKQTRNPLLCAYSNVKLLSSTYQESCQPAVPLLVCCGLTSLVIIELPNDPLTSGVNEFSYSNLAQSRL